MGADGGSLSFDRVADRYDETRGGEPRGRSFAAVLAPLLDPDAPVLEVGIGTGLVAAGLRGLGFTVTGVDLAPAMLSRARERLGPVVAVGDAARLPVRDDAVDQVVVVWLLHLVPDLPAVLAELARVLRPGGRLLVVPSRAGDPGDDPAGRLLVEMSRRLAPGTADHVAEILEAAGAAGFTLAGRHHTEVDQILHSPSQTADAVEARVWSSLWHLTDEQWATVVEPTIAALRALPDVAASGGGTQPILELRC
jgi:ubiquinone/menaquinone biosynthesis C-methylase UbiE